MKLNSPPSGGGGGDALPAADVSPPGETQSGRWRTTSGSTCRQLRFCFCSFSSGMLVKKSGMSSGADRTFSSSVDSLLTPPPTPPAPCFRSLVSHLRDAKQDEGKKKITSYVLNLPRPSFPRALTHHGVTVKTPGMISALGFSSLEHWCLETALKQHLKGLV